MIAAYISIAFLLLFGVSIVFLLIRNEFVYRAQQAICMAIFLYRKRRIEDGLRDYEVSFDDMREYGNMMWRLWDWSYKQVLPPEKFEIIKPYIQKEKK